MPKHRPTHRVAKSVTISVGIRTFVIAERRAGPWLKTLAASAVALAVWGAMQSTLPTDIARMWVGIALIGIVTLVAWYVLPWNGRVRVDLDTDECEVQWRFFAIPIHRTLVPIDGRRFARAEGMLTYETTVTSDEDEKTAGCILGLILGPLSWFLPSPKVRKRVTVHERHEGLALLHAPGGAELLMAVEDIGSLDEALMVARQITG